MVTLGVKYIFFLEKMMPNIGIMQITSKFGPFDNATKPQKYIWEKS
jgi:hypothetical protein